MYRRLVTISLMLVAFSMQLFAAPEEARLLRFPTVSGDKVVFSYAGDLFVVSADGGVAQRLTNDEGYEMFSHFSPDGKTIAFTAQYDGNTEVYTMPVTGGEPKRLTYTATLGRDDISDRMGPNNIVMGWKDDNTVVYRSRWESFDAFKGKLYLASTKGGLSEELPLPLGGFCSYSPDGTKLAYNRVFREFRTWKYYQGGMADNVWIYDFKTEKIEPICENVHQNIFPMWSGDVVYYLSDRDRIMNMFAYDTKTKQTTKVTNFDRYDIKFPTLGDKYIVFENGGYIYKFDLATQKSHKLTIYINEDMSGGRTEYKDLSRTITSMSLSPNAKRVVAGSRGEVFTVPVDKGITRNITQTSGVHERDAMWSPDGKWIAYIADTNGEDEIYIRAQDGLSEPVKITKNSDTYKYEFEWSPDSKKILWSDQMNRLRYVDVDSKKVTQVEHSMVGELRDYAWSPDSRWIAYRLPRARTTSVIVVYDVNSGKKEEVTDDWFSSFGVSFSNDGKYLVYLSSRTFNPTYSRTEWNHAYTDMNGIYITPLQSDVNPFAYKNDEGYEAPAEKNDKKAEEKKDVVVNIDFDGIKERSLAIDVPTTGFTQPICIDDVVYYNRRDDSAFPMFMYDLKEQKETNLGRFGLRDISSDYTKFLVYAHGGGGFGVINTPKSPITLKETISLADMKTVVNLREEWQQIYDECWRQMRDFFYDPDMHGVDWKDIHAKYKPLVKHVNERNDLNYIIGELIGEANAGHAYIGGGDRVMPKRVTTGLLGAQLSRDKSGFYRIDRILEGRNWDESLRSPLTEAGIGAKEGDFITAINGHSTKEMNDIYAALYDKAGREVELTLNGSAAAGGRTVIVKPIADEADLYYYNWVQENVRKVDEATNGKVGYIHIPDMGPGGLNEFVKHYYPQLNKQALIIDDRGNGGGNVSPMIIERLRREISMMSQQRNGDPSPKPEGMFVGPKVLLIDRYSASDGDLFPYQFRHYGLGTLIGERTWGGVVGIRGTLPLIDGGQLNRPEFAHFDATGKEFIIEGHGVEPDIHVDNDPATLYKGVDQQLNKAIEVILDELKRNPPQIPTKAPAYPDKSK